MSAATTRFRDGAGWEDEAGYSRAVRRGGRIEVSGTTADTADGVVQHPGDTYAQTRSALERALIAVRHLGADAEDVVRTRVYLAPDAHWEAAVEAHREVFGAVAPANTMLYVGGLIGPGRLVEVEVEAQVPG